MNNHVEIEISDDPISSYKRKVFVDVNAVNFKTEEVKFEAVVVYYKEDPNVPGAYGDLVKYDTVINKNGRFNDFIKPLSTKGRYIDSTNGNVVLYEPNNPNILPEFDYIMSLTSFVLGLTGNDTFKTLLTTLCATVITTRVAEGEFN